MYLCQYNIPCGYYGRQPALGEPNQITDAQMGGVRGLIRRFGGEPAGLRWILADLRHRLYAIWVYLVLGARTRQGNFPSRIHPAPLSSTGTSCPCGLAKHTAPQTLDAPFWFSGLGSIFCWQVETGCW